MDLKHKWSMFLSIRNPFYIIYNLLGKDPSSFSLSEIQAYLTEEPKVIIEAGAFDGSDTAKLASFWSSAMVYSFEPIPDLYQLAVNRTKELSNVKLFNLALSGDSANSVEINTFGNDEKKHGSSSILAPEVHKDIHPRIRFGNKITVPSTSLDDWYRNEKIGVVDFLWLDLQGAEILVLNAGIECLKKSKIIQIEVSKTQLYRGAPTFEEVKAFMAENEFFLIKKKIPGFTGNALFANQKFLGS